MCPDEKWRQNKWLNDLTYAIFVKLICSSKSEWHNTRCLSSSVSYSTDWSQGRYGLDNMTLTTSTSCRGSKQWRGDDRHGAAFVWFIHWWSPTQTIKAKSLSIFWIETIFVHVPVERCMSLFRVLQKKKIGFTFIFISNFKGD